MAITFSEKRKNVSSFTAMQGFFSKLDFFKELLKGLYKLQKGYKNRPKLQLQNTKSQKYKNEPELKLQKVQKWTKITIT